MKLTISKSDLELMRSFYIAMTSPQWANSPNTDMTRRAFFGLLCRLSKEEARGGSDVAQDAEGIK